MRDLIDKLNNVLNESRGMSARQPGEEFVRTNSKDPNDIIVFKGLTFYPESGKYDSNETLMKAFYKVQQKIGGIEQLNKPSKQGGGFAVATFDTAYGVRHLAKFANEIKPVRTQNTFFQTQDIPGGFTYKTAKAQKETVGYKPSQILTNFKSQTPESILAQISAKFGPESDEYRAAEIFNSASQFPIEMPAGNMDFAGFRDYFCEMLQPIALIHGMPIKGNANKAAEIFLDGTYSDCVVSFNQSVGGELYDSLLINPAGKQIKLSSKGAKGAMASSVNLLKSVRELENAGMTQFREQYADVIDILETIGQGNHDSGPLNLAIEQGMITSDEAAQVMSLKQYAGVKDFNIDDTDITDNLKKIYKERKADDPSKIVPLNHLVSSIAYKVCNGINLGSNFSEAAADILNNSAFVQMYTEAKKVKDSFVITGFTTVWPSKLFTEVTLEAQKSYSSTSSSGGKLVFNINKEPKAIPNVENNENVGYVDDKKARGGEIVDFIPQRTDITARSGASTSTANREKNNAASDTALGRKRR